MRSYCNCTPYTLNLKLKNFCPVTRNNDLNKLYKQLSDSIPQLTNQFCCLKSKTKALNKSLNKIPIVYNNSFTTNRSCSNYFSKKINSSPNISDSYYNYTYKSPKPVIKSYHNNNIKYHYHNHINPLENKYNINYRCGNCGINNFKNNNQIKLNFNYDSYSDNPIRNYTKLNNRNNSAINMIRNDYKDDKYHNLNYDFNNNINNNYNKLNNINDVNKYEYENKYQNLNDEINQKYQMQSAIDDTFDNLNKKNHENSILQSEILELKTKSHYNMNNNFNDMNNNNNYYNNNVNQKFNNSYIQNRENNHKKKNYNLNEQKYNNYNNNNFKDYYSNKSDDVNMGHKGEKFKNINKKMDNLLYKNEKKLKKYGNIK